MGFFIRHGSCASLFVAPAWRSDATLHCKGTAELPDVQAWSCSTVHRIARVERADVSSCTLAGGICRVCATSLIAQR
jgi:hypothetical protein